MGSILSFQDPLLRRSSLCHAPLPCSVPSSLPSLAAASVPEPLPIWAWAQWEPHYLEGWIWEGFSGHEGYPASREGGWNGLPLFSTAQGFNPIAGVSASPSGTHSLQPVGRAQQDPGSQPLLHTLGASTPAGAEAGGCPKPPSPT